MVDSFCEENLDPISELLVQVTVQNPLYDRFLIEITVLLMMNISVVKI